MANASTMAAASQQSKLSLESRKTQSNSVTRGSKYRGLLELEYITQFRGFTETVGYNRDRDESINNIFLKKVHFRDLLLRTFVICSRFLNMKTHREFFCQKVWIFLSFTTSVNIFLEHIGNEISENIFTNKFNTTKSNLRKPEK